MLTADDCALYKHFVDKYQPYLYALIGAHVARVHGRIGGRIVDMGTGPGYLSAELAERTGALVHAVDINPAFHEMARSHIERRGLGDRVVFDLVDVHDLPYPEGFADLVVSYSCLHHWANPRKGVQECLRILAPGGRMILIDTQPVGSEVLAALRRAIPEDELFRFVDEAIAESYTQADVEAIVREAGLQDFSIKDFIFDEEDLVECMDQIDAGSSYTEEMPDGVATAWILIGNKP